MRKILDEVFCRKKLQIFFLFYILMALPLLISMAENVSLIDRFWYILINIFLFLSMAVLSVFWRSRTEKLIYSFLFIISYLPFSIYTTYLLLARVLLQKNSLISLFETNPEESKEFMIHYLNPLAIAAGVVYIFVCFLIIWVMKSSRPLRIKEHKQIFILSLTIFLLIIAVPSLSRYVYFINFYTSYTNYKITLSKEQIAVSERQLSDYEVKTIPKDTTPKTIVLVVGESLTRTHMSLYGYPRNTNPKLSEYKDNFYVYNEVVSPQVHTIPVLRSVLTLSDKNDMKAVVDKPSFFELFNRAGYESYFISNQPFSGKFSTSYDMLLKLSKNEYDLSKEKQPDEIILPKLKEILSEHTQKDRVIMIHLIGNHIAYEFRYTPTFNVFHTQTDDVDKVGSTDSGMKEHTRDKYDNSVLYNDFVISEMIRMLEKYAGENSALVYFSDHGEEVYEFRDFYGHAYEKVTTYMCEIPFLVWLSPDYLQHRPDLVIEPERPFSTAAFLYSFSHLAGLNYKDFISSRSLFSKDYVPTKRYVGDYTYQEVIEKTRSLTCAD